MNAHPEIVPSLVDRIKQTLVGLKMPRAIEILDVTVRRLERGEMTAIEAIDALLAEELTLRENRRIKIALMMARLSTIKTLAGFDFSFQPSLDRNRILYLAQLDFIDRSSISSANRHRQRSPRRSTWRRSNPCPHSQGTPSNAGKTQSSSHTPIPFRLNLFLLRAKIRRGTCDYRLLPYLALSSRTK
jgi:hypothetical protein